MNLIHSQSICAISTILYYCTHDGNVDHALRSGTRWTTCRTNPIGDLQSASADESPGHFQLHNLPATPEDPWIVLFRRWVADTTRAPYIHKQGNKEQGGGRVGWGGKYLHTDIEQIDIEVILLRPMIPANNPITQAPSLCTCLLRTEYGIVKSVLLFRTTP